MAGSVEVTPDWAPVAERIRAEATDTWDDTVAVERFEGKGGRFVRGEGRFVGPGRVAVGDRMFEATKAVVVATGTRAAVPPIPGLSDTPFWTNREAIEVETLPASIIVLGGGAIGSELAQVYARFGVKVSVVEGLDRLLPPEEPESSALLAEVFASEGIAVHTGQFASKVSHANNEFLVELADGTKITGEKLLVAAGRRTDLAGLGIDAIGLDGASRFLDVDENLSFGDGLWAVGDITGKGAFTHVGMYQAAIAVADILGQDHLAAEYAALPRVTFTDPEVGSVGMSEAQAIEAGVDVRTSLVNVQHTARGWLHKAGNEGLIKLVADANTGLLVGATAAGPSGGEVLGLLSLAVHAKVPISEMQSMIWAYPTFHRGIEDAVNALDL